MNAIAATIAQPFRRSNTPAKGGFDISAAQRYLIGAACFTMSFVCILAIGRALLGFAPDLPHLSKLPIVIHVATVLPAIPLGGYLLLARKGTPRHKQLGKLWLVLMLVTATSAIFIKSSGQFSFIHIFIPLTFHASWKAVSTARKGDIAGHKRQLVITYLTALMIPGIFAFALPGRLMNVMLFG